MSDIILGIDLGTTNSAVGTVDSGFPILLANEDGKRITPSAVWVGRSGEIEVGASALRRRALEPDQPPFPPRTGEAMRSPRPPVRPNG